MKVVILCGGQGSRIRDVSEVLPKPMLSIGDRPILWHIMKIYSSYGFKEFILCLGYKGWMIKDFFINYTSKISDISLSLGREDSLFFHNANDEFDWKITLAETGENAQTGARVKRIERYLKGSDHFCLTYGDGVANVDLNALVKQHRASKMTATITGVHPIGRFGEIEIDENRITEFNEKPNVSTGLINGGFMVMNTKAIGKYFTDEEGLNLETDVMPKIVKDGQMGIYRHEGFWNCMDTPREYSNLNQLWDTRKAPWKVWA